MRLLRCRSSRLRAEKIARAVFPRASGNEGTFRVPAPCESARMPAHRSESATHNRLKTDCSPFRRKEERKAPAARRISRSIGSRVVSIHAPARGATCESTRDERELKVSIHAPARGATSTGHNPGQCTSFNSRPCERGNLRQCRFGAAEHVSIHAPARGATPRYANAWQR